MAQAGAKDVGIAVDAAREAFEAWSAWKPSERAKVLFRIARILQERARELAVAESLDGGKPIKESRDVDLPLAAAHFFYYAGWADKLEYAFPDRRPRPLGVAAQIVPWNFPLLMLAWKIAPALACGNTVVLKPAETTPLTALLFADVCRQAQVPPGCRQHRHGRRRDRRAPRPQRGDRQGRVHGLDRGRQGDPARARRARIPLTLELGGKAANIVFDDARSTRRSRGSSTASTSTRATSAAPARGSSCRSRSTTSSCAS